ncbi:hypothetical protein BFW01_g5399 [Lasiodiplodia theobromae]|uniref:SWI/SNF and RSC complexes subunit ssr4 n=2 Tax=Lasiodiplodia TaxID=66739 RepID=A0A5N5DQF8_9PEZI|nr:uncharacterized protein LTHEOB_955 [Lasiodiplodia theobromae]KAB2580033.1 hypothetical protein DBV05_g1567 [Lasiodiplodia theobromae]KAF4541013.1 hypothetical protein LTHEOB_955 [Lasiodiplodia theobromae]KAF9634504.1 hypothetical protein BFW01_g5399 [Lasiodiplodia theobromae]KAK0660214.1 hypothetical protein DIS24_g3455 [Lasiodiplodia hormozganensis]
MQDPSFGVPQFLLPHVHLISSFRYPTLAHISVDQAVEFLLQAPKVVKDMAPMAWQYFQNPPNDGTVFLEWQPVNQRSNAYASDGYIWADPESSFTYESQRGYTVEILVRRSGYRPGFEPVTSHQRHRYRIISRNPASQGPIPDQALFLVHYSAAEPQARVPANRIPINAEMQKMMQERRFLESQGQLMERKFMLHDRHNWPNISFPGTGQMQQGHVPPGGMYPGHPMQAAAGGFRQPQFYPPGQASAIGPSPAKRPRNGAPPHLPGNVPAGMPAAAVGMPHDTTIEEEENTAIGDLLDNLTPRDISTMRYIQHHEWMEEVFSSPFAAGQIMPVDLGLGLMGELSHLTEGLFDAPGASSLPGGPKPPAAPKAYQKLSKEKYADFEDRVKKFLKDEEAELEKMRAEHEKKMAELTKSKTYVEAERRLRDAAFADARAAREKAENESGSPESEGEETTGQVDEVVADVEKTLGITIAPRKNVNCVEKGGLVEEPLAPAATNGSEANGAENAANIGESNGSLEDSAMDGDNTAAGLLEQYTSNSLVSTPGGSSLQVPPVSQPDSQGQSANATPGGTAQPGQAQGQNQSTVPAQSDNSNGDNGMDLIEGMDLDIDMSGMGGEGTTDKAADDWVMVGSNSMNDSDLGGETGQAKDGSAGGTGTIDTPDLTTTSAQGQDGTTTSAPASAAGNTPGMFDATDFSAFDTAGDALADYTGGDDLDLGLEGDAFGDAFHGTETRNDVDDDGANS